MSASNPLKTGERIQQRLAGTTPVIVADANTLAFVLDPRLTTPSNATLSIRHGPSTLMSISDLGQGGADLGQGAILAGGEASGLAYSNAATLPPSSISLRTTTAGLEGGDQTDAMVERLVVGPGDIVTSQSDFRVVGDMLVEGPAYLSEYTHLVDDFMSSSITVPPTANALKTAYLSLSNLIVNRMLTGPDFSWSSNYASNGCGCGPFSPLLPPEWNPLALSNYGWWVAEHGQAEDAIVAGPVACTTLFVAPGGSVVASSYCNLVDSYLVSDVTMPPTADALNAAYLQLSNLVVLKVRDAELKSRFYSNLPPDWLSNLGHASFGADVWLTSDPDGFDRLRFPSASNAPVEFAAGPATTAASEAFAWTDFEKAPLMTLRQGGDLLVEGFNLAVGRNSVSSYAFVVGSNGVSVAHGDIAVLDGGARFSGALSVGDAASFGGPVVFNSNVNVGGALTLAGGLTLASVTTPGAVTAGAYCNLPYVQRSNNSGPDSPGIVSLVETLSETSNVAVSAAGVRAVYEGANARCDYLQGFLADVSYAAYSASNIAAPTSNVAFARVGCRAFDEADAAVALVLTNRSGASNAAVKILMGAGVGPSPEDLWIAKAADPAFVADVYGSNCASVSTTAAGEMVLEGAGTVGTNSGQFVVIDAPSQLAVGNAVAIRSTASSTTGGAVPSFPPPTSILTPTSVSGFAWTDPDSAAIYEASASSVFAVNAPWCAARQGFACDDSPWISAAGKYDDAGNATVDAAQTSGADLGDPQNPGFGVDVVVGEWLQLTSVPGAFVTRFSVATGDGAQYVPHDFLLLGATQLPPTTWTILSVPEETQNQGPFLQAAGALGIQYSIDPRFHATQYAAFRLVVTRVAIAEGYNPAPGQANVQIDAFRLNGNVFAPMPNLLFTVDETTLVVDRAGHVGVGCVAPCAPLHVGAVDALVPNVSFPSSLPVVVLSVPLALSNLEPTANVSNMQYRGWGVSSNALNHQVETGARHVFRVGSNQVAEVDETGLNVSGTTCVGSNLIVPHGNLVVGKNMTVSGSLVAQESGIVQGGFVIGGALVVRGDAIVEATSIVQGDQLVDGNAVVQGDLTVVDGATRLGGSLVVTRGTASFAGAVAASSDLVVGGDLTVDGALRCDSIVRRNAPETLVSTPADSPLAASFASVVAYGRVPSAGVWDVFATGRASSSSTSFDVIFGVVRYAYDASMTDADALAAIDALYSPYPSADQWPASSGGIPETTCALLACTPTVVGVGASIRSAPTAFDAGDLIAVVCASSSVVTFGNLGNKLVAVAL